MAISQKTSNRKPTGGKYNILPGKKMDGRGGLPVYTKVGERKGKTVKTRGKNTKRKLLTANEVNLIDPKTQKHSRVKITSVYETPANRNYARRNILTKGTVVETEKGKARITSRPGQDGQVNAVLV